LKVQDYTFSKAVRKDTGLLDFFADLKNILNFGRYVKRVVSTPPTHTGEAGEEVHYISGKVKRRYWYDATNSTWQYSPVIVATVSLIDQDAAIGATTLFTPSASGLYRVQVYQVCTVAGTGGVLATTIGWTDDEQAQVSKPASDVDLTVLGEAASGILFLRGTPVAITYTSTAVGIAGGAEFALFIVLEQLA